MLVAELVPEQVRFLRRLIAFTLVVIPLGVLASQPHPDFSGRWIAVEPQKIAGHELLVTQDTATLRLEQVRLESRATYDSFGRRQGPATGTRESTTYRLDGQTLVTRYESQSVRSSLRGDNTRLLLRDVYQPPGITFERSLSLDSRGRLVLEHRVPAAGDDPMQASDAVLDVRRIVFERR
jgi:hypothetical protein